MAPALSSHAHTTHLQAGLILAVSLPHSLCLWTPAVSHWYLQDVLTRSTIISEKDEVRELSSAEEPKAGRFCLHVYKVGNGGGGNRASPREW